MCRLDASICKNIERILVELVVEPSFLHGKERNQGRSLEVRSYADKARKSVFQVCLQRDNYINSVVADRVMADRGSSFCLRSKGHAQLSRKGQYFIAKRYGLSQPCGCLRTGHAAARPRCCVAHPCCRRRTSRAGPIQAERTRAGAGDQAGDAEAGGRGGVRRASRLWLSPWYGLSL